MANDKVSRSIIQEPTQNKHTSRLISAVDMALGESPQMPDRAQYGFVAILQTPTVILYNNEFDMEFDIPFDDDMVANEAEFTVYNLTASTANKFKVGNSIAMTAGYETDRGVIFQGYISKVQTRKQGVDRVTTIYALDDVKYTPQMMDEKTYTEGAKASGILKDLLNRTGLEIAVFKPDRDITYYSETTLEGSLTDNIKEYSSICGVSTYVYKQKIYCRPIRDGDNLWFFVNSGTGMIESPEPFEEEQTYEDFVDTVKGFNINMILQHRIATAGIVKVDSENYSGEYRIVSGTHSYDGLSATTQFKCIDTISTRIEEKESRSSSSKSSTSKSNSSVISKAVSWALKIAKDNSHGYSQKVRWGPHYDCSSFVISAYRNAGLSINATYTGDMYSGFKNAGFADVTNAVNLSTGADLKKGDVLLNKAHHAALVRAKGGAIVHSSNAKNGICTRDYYNYPWDCVLRYKG